MGCPCLAIIFVSSKLAALSWESPVQAYTSAYPVRLLTWGLPRQGDMFVCLLVVDMGIPIQASISAQSEIRALTWESPRQGDKRAFSPKARFVR